MAVMIGSVMPSVPGLAISVAVSSSIPATTPTPLPPPPLFLPHLLPRVLFRPNPLVHPPLLHSHPSLRILHTLHPTRPRHNQRIRPRKLCPLTRDPRRNRKPQRCAQRILLRLFYPRDLFGAGARGVLSCLGGVAFGVPGEVFVFLPAADG